tara:strand:- start:271 stop:618 length:348 start_codon:yes stop_codon:yes gene_type:complete
MGMEKNKNKKKCPMCNREITVIGKKAKFARHIGINSPLEFGGFSAGSIKSSNGTECFGSKLPSEWTKDFIELKFLNWRKSRVEWIKKDIPSGRYQGKDLIYVQKILEKEIKELNQ